MTVTLDDLDTAVRTREVIQNLAAGVFDQMFPRPRYALVISTDPPNQKVELQYPDEVSNTFWLPATTIMPQTGSVVRVSGFSGARYIDEIQTGDVRINGDLDVVGSVTFGSGPGGGTLGSMAFQDADDVDITGGSVTGLSALGFNDGSVGSPTLRFDTDTDTGLYRAGVNAIGFASGGSNVLTLDLANGSSLNGSLDVSGVIHTSAGAGLSLGGGTGVNRIVTYGSGPTTRFLDVSNGYSNVGLKGLSVGSALAGINPPVNGAQFEGNVEFGGWIQAPTYVSQTTGWNVTAAGAADFRYLYADEMHVKSFVADLEQALAGGQIIGKSVAVVARDFVVPAPNQTATLWVEDLPSMPNAAAFQSGDQVVLRTITRASDGSLQVADCVGVVTSYTDGAETDSNTIPPSYLTNEEGRRLTNQDSQYLTNGTTFTPEFLAVDSDTYLLVTATTGLAVVSGATDVSSISAAGLQSWAFTRNQVPYAGTATTGTTVVHRKTLAIDYGTSGNGVYEVSAIDGPFGANAPYMQIKSWTIAPVASQFQVWTRIGKLTGITSVPDEYGAIFGSWGTRTTTPAVRLSTHGSEFFNIASTWYSDGLPRIKINPSQPSIAVGDIPPVNYLNGVGFWVGRDTDIGQMRLHIGNPGGNHLRFDGNNLSVTGALYATAGEFLGYVTAANGVVRIGSNVAGINEDGFTMDGTTFNAWFRRNNNNVNATLRNTTYFSAGDAAHRIQMDTGTQTYTINWPNFSVATNGTVTLGAGSLSGVLQIGNIKLGSAVRASFNGLDLDGELNYWLKRTTDDTTWFALGNTNSILSYNSEEGIVRFTGIINAQGGTFTDRVTAAAGVVQIGNNINGAPNFAGLTITGDWNNAWVRRPDGTHYFRAGDATRYIMMDSGNTFVIEFPNFHVDSSGRMVATSGQIGGINIASNKLWIGVGNYVSNDTPLYLDSSGNMSLGNRFAWNAPSNSLVIGQLADTANVYMRGVINFESSGTFGRIHSNQGMSITGTAGSMFSVGAGAGLPEFTWWHGTTFAARFSLPDGLDVFNKVTGRSGLYFNNSTDINNRLFYRADFNVAMLAGAAGVFIYSAINERNFHFSNDGNAYAPGAWVDSSSITIKKNIHALKRKDARALLHKLRPVWYNPNEDDSPRQLGFVAELTERVLPEVVVTRPGETQPSGIAYGRITPVLVAAVQAIDQDLSQRMKAMETEMAALKEMLKGSSND